jgi:acetyl/propionyl-CoA carboxylase alpha subunit
VTSRDANGTTSFSEVHKDGSTTSSTSNPDGSYTVDHHGADNTHTVTQYNAEGSSTITTQNALGSTRTTTTDATGHTTETQNLKGADLQQAFKEASDRQSRGEATAADQQIRIDDRRIVTASASGPVESLEVHAGQRVEVGDVLLRMTSKDESAELARATTEHDLQLVHYLVDPHDQSGRQQLSTLRGWR